MDDVTSINSIDDVLDNAETLASEVIKYNLVNQEILSSLPLALRNTINSLDRAHINVLRAALNKFPVFDFLALPLEMRRKVYRFLLLPADGRVCRSRNHRSTCISPSIFLVSVQILEEAQDVFYRETTCLLKCNTPRHSPEWLALNKTALIMGRKITLAVDAYTPHIAFGSGNKHSIGFMLKTICDWHAQRCATESNAPITLELKFKTPSAWDTNSGYAVNIFDADETNVQRLTLEYILRATWYRVHIIQVMETMREELASLAAHVTITFNVDLATSTSHAKRINAKEVRCYVESIDRVYRLNLQRVDRNSFKEESLPIGASL
ncbi:hypothetical protein EJ08DRAFT_730832 [Tothia fuscella]|uniref:F-box domain-containing protein n=1 Tax=Tothia fuscella TaxID=1048955 RepID=A0A9P4NZU2_9PEZI|nr:hypothetical protein EJ08DRAFT_730832 [Tothia fuscella]